MIVLHENRVLFLEAFWPLGLGFGLVYSFIIYFINLFLFNLEVVIYIEIIMKRVFGVTLLSAKTVFQMMPIARTLTQQHVFVCTFFFISIYIFIIII